MTSGERATEEVAPGASGNSRPLVLLAGATGYLGRRLVEPLLDEGYAVRCLARRPSKLDGEPWRDRVEVVRGDVSDPASLADAFDSVHAALYLVHSIGAEVDWERRDREAAANFRDAAAGAGVAQIVYLGGLGDSAGGRLSAHLASRHEVGRVLAAGPVPVTELRAAVIIGSGSASFEMLRHLVERLPVMVAPKWVDTPVQPIGVADVLAYLVGVLDHESALGRVLEVGGRDTLTYREMMQTYARVAGLRPRLIVPVPVLSPKLSSLWIGLVTPVPSSLARPLVDSLVNPVVVKDDAIRSIVPIEPIDCATAIERALRRIDEQAVLTRWTDAELHGRTPADPMPTDPTWAGGTLLVDRQERRTTAGADAVFDEICRVGGDAGWPSADWLWAARGLIDRVFGGPGMRRGRRHPLTLRVGDVVDFWRVEDFVPGRLLRLRAEMLLPGDAWLTWEVSDAGGTTLVTQTATFHPRGLWGRAYWYAVAPFHRFVFAPMVTTLCARAEARGVPAVL